MEKYCTQILLAIFITTSTFSIAFADIEQNATTTDIGIASESSLASTTTPNNSLAEVVSTSTNTSTSYNAITIKKVHEQSGNKLRFLKVFPQVTELGIQNGITDSTVCSYISFRGSYQVGEIRDFQNPASIVNITIPARFSEVDSTGACIFDFGDGYIPGPAGIVSDDIYSPRLYALSVDTSLENIIFKTEAAATADTFANITYRQYGYFRWANIIDVSQTVAAQNAQIKISVCGITEYTNECIQNIPYQRITLKNLPTTPIKTIEVSPEISESAIERGVTVLDVCRNLKLTQNNWIDNYGYGFYNYTNIATGASAASGGCVFAFATETTLPTYDSYWGRPISYSIKIQPEPELFTEKEIGFVLESMPGNIPDRYTTFGTRFRGSPLFYWETLFSEYTYDPVFFNKIPTSITNQYNVETIINGKKKCTTACYSSILFLPGIMGSRLYSGSDKLWDTLAVQGGDTQQARLAMDTNGYSIENIHTGADTVEGSAVIDTVAGQDIYKSFIQDLSKWTNQDKLITDYAVIPYDWRLPLDQIVQKGKEVDGKVYYGSTVSNLSDSFIVQRLRRLVDSSKSGKVTIIAHSNGGLVTKELIQTLKETNNPLYDKIDKIIMVAVPQVGTPEAVLSILHGKEVGLVGAAINQKRMRSLAENMPMSYNLLPNQNYLDVLDSYALDNKIVTFDDSPALAAQRAKYGNLVNNQTELQSFISGTDGRIKPGYSNIGLPNIGNNTLYTNSNTTHQRIDTFELASPTKLVQVAGWGEDTVVGIDYKSYLKEDGSYYPSFKVRKVVDGDGTVVVPSALYTSTSNSNVERWWVNLDKFNGLFGSKDHAKIFEILEVKNFISQSIQNRDTTTNQIISTTQPTAENIKRLHYTLHSPLTLSIIDTQGRYTGVSTTTQEVINQIPGVNYDTYGEVQTISVPVGLAHTVVLDGYETGSFSLDIDKQEGNTTIASTTFSGIPSTSDTTVTLAMNEQADISSTKLQIDSNSDGSTDITLQAVENSQVIYQKPKDTPSAVSYGGGGGSYYIPQLSTSTSTSNEKATTTAASIIKEATTSTSTEKIAKNTVKPVQKKVTKVTKPTPKTITKKQQPDQPKLAKTNKISQVAAPILAANNSENKTGLFTRIKNSIKRIFGVQ